MATTGTGKAIFLSYASQDADEARRIGDALGAAGLEVWFDQSELRGGDAWDEKIRRQIAECALFLPVISQTTAARLEGYFRLEWSLADQRTQRMARTRPFIVPVCVDTTHESAADVPESFLRVQWSRLPGGATTPAFVEHVRTLLPGEQSSPASRKPPAASIPHPPATATTAPRRRGRAVLYAAVAATLIAGAGLYVAMRRPSPAGLAAPGTETSATGTAAVSGIPEKSIAVLPFLDISEKKDQEYFSDGLAEELLDLLAQVPDLKVAARTSSFYFKGRAEDIATIGAKLRVSHVLEGSVRRAGPKVRVTAQLIRADNGYHVWSQTYDRDVKDIFKVQDEISSAVVAALKVQLMGATTRVAERRSNNPEAYDQYLLGVHEYRIGDPQSVARASAAFQRSIAADPNYGPPYAALAMTEFIIAADYAEEVDAPRVQHALALADKAIALAPDLADAYSTRAFLRMNYRFDWTGAKSDIDRALQLAPNDSNNQRRAGFLIQSLGQPLDAVAAQRRAVALDPMDTNSVDALAEALIEAGQYEEARKAVARLREISPTFRGIQGYIGTIYLYEHHPELAKEACELEPGLDGRACLAVAEFQLGNKARYTALLSELTTRHAKRGAYAIAGIYAQTGDTERALDWLERALTSGNRELNRLRSNPDFAAIRTQPRYLAALDKLHLPH